jgi:hypothetical protein
MRWRTVGLLLVVGCGLLTGCGDDDGENDAVDGYCEAVAEYVQLAQDDPTNPEVEDRLREIEAEGADLARQSATEEGSIDEAQLNECSNQLRQIEPGG